VFVHCRLGLNRSGLVTGLMLIDEGYRAEDAIHLLRDLRSPLVLQNPAFERYLLWVDGKRQTDAAA
jgi:protein-tyrosine phosphatase